MFRTGAIRSLSRQGIGLLAMCMVSMFSDVTFADENALALRVKSAFIYNFTKFLTWPDSSFAEQNDPISICVAGNREMLESLKQIVAGKVVQRRSVSALYVESHKDIGSCKLLYLSDSHQPLEYWVSANNARHLISIGDGDDFIDQGGTIGFVAHNGKIRFEINQGSASKQQVHISSKLLSLAQRVTY